MPTYDLEEKYAFQQMVASGQSIYLRVKAFPIFVPAADGLNDEENKCAFSGIVRTVLITHVTYFIGQP